MFTLPPIIGQSASFSVGLTAIMILPAQVTRYTTRFAIISYDECRL